MAEFQLPPEARPRERWKKRLAILAVIFLALIAVGVLAQVAPHLELRLWPEEYEEVMRPKGGFYMGKVAGNVLVFVFYEHPQYGLYPVEDGDLIPANELIFYLFSFEDTEATIKLDEYIPETRVIGNSTVTLKLENRTYEDSITIPGRHFQRVTMRLAEARVMKRLDIYVNGQLIMCVRHKTFPAFVGVGYYTLGSLEADRAAFVGLAVLACVIGFGLARATINKVRYVPSLPRWLEALSLFIGVATVAAAWWLITYYALIRAIHLLVPVGLVAYVYGLMLMRIRPSEFYLTYMEIGAGQPRKHILVVPVIRKLSEAEYEVAPQSWRDFLKALFGRTRKLRLISEDGAPKWFIDLGEGDREYVIEDLVVEDGGVLMAKVAGTHALDVELWTYDRLSVEDLARDKEHYRKALMDLRRLSIPLMGF